MIKKALSSSVILLAFVLVGSRAIAVGQEQGPFQGLIGAAEVVVAVEILSTDYTATAADGPLVAVANVLKVLKGPFPTGKQFRFTETAWVGPTYQKGEARILFLEKNTSAESPRAAEWRILSHLYARTDFFIDEDSLADLSLESLESLLKNIQESNSRPPKVVFGRR
jgi:hypothetical protein